VVLEVLTSASLGLAVFAGAGVQRVTGLGFALVSSPLLVLLAGPLQGVQLANALSIAVSLAVLPAVRRDVDLNRAVLLLLPALVAVPAGAWVTRHLAAAHLMVLVGGLLVLALVAGAVSPRARVFRGTGGAVAAGALSGFMNVTAGVGGPAIVLYARSVDWQPRRLVATFQLYAIVLNVASLAAKGRPHVTAGELVACLVGLSVGVICGHFVARRVSAEQAARGVFVVALGGALATLIRGVLGW
jgi:uncharacterized membrane protein YfcA